MFFDLKYAFRQLAKSPGFSAIAIVILALGIGSNTAVFTVIDGLLLRGMPVSHPENLAVLTSRRGSPRMVSYPMFQQFSTEARSFAGVAVATDTGRSMTASGFGRTDATPVLTSVVSGNYFSLLGVPACLGRTLTPDDDRPDAARAVAVLGYSLWQHQFGGDPGVLGKTILIDHVELTIVGVAAPAFRGINAEVMVDVWVPLQMDPILNPGDAIGFHEPTASRHFWLRAIGRMRPGVTIESAQTEMDLLFHRELSRLGMTAETLNGYGLDGLELRPGGSGFIAKRDQIASLLQILFLVAGAVLLIACSNVASLLLARTTARQREFSLRTALGAGRARIVRQLTTESLILAILGGGLGLLVAHWGTLLIATYMPETSTLDLSLDSRVFYFSVGISLAAGIFVGVVPALRFTRIDLMSAFKVQANTLTGAPHQMLNRALVALQIALSVCLLAGAGLFVRTLQNLRSIDLGFNPDNLLSTWVVFDNRDDPTGRAAASRNVLASLKGLAQVSAATFVWKGGGLVAGTSDNEDHFSVQGYVPHAGEPPLVAYSTFVGTDFFETTGVRILRGRGFNASEIFAPKGSPDPDATSEIVVNEAFARRFYGDRDPVGRVVRVPDDNWAAEERIKPVAFRIIGVSRGTREGGLRDDNALEMFLPCSAMGFLPRYLLPRGMMVEIRTSGNPLALASEVRSVIGKTDPDLRVILSTTIDESIDRAVFQERMVAQTAGLFSVVALALAALGLYGVLAYNVAQRIREIGVRMALGASQASIVALVLKQGMSLTAVGCGIGIGTAALLSSLVASRLYGVTSLDPTTFVCAIAGLFLVAFFACWLPARRAMKVDPLVALRAE